MKVLIIGGSGFLSGTLAHTALKAGHHVDIVTRGRRPLPEGTVAIVADRDDEDAFAQAIAVRGAAGNWDLVVDCIGFTEANAEQTIRHFRNRAGRVVFISTDFVIASSPNELPQEADSVVCHTDNQTYGGRKRHCELAFQATRQEWLDWTILRPAHIYGPGSLLGCLPEHGRQRDLVQHILDERPLRLVGGGLFLQQPVLATDLSEVILAVPGSVEARGEIYMVPGPETMESRRYYEVVAEMLNRIITIEPLPVEEYRKAHPERSDYLRHRVYDATKLQRHGLPLPATPFAVGMKEHLAALTPLGVSAK